MPRTTATRPVIASSVTGSRWPYFAHMLGPNGLWPIDHQNDHCCKPFSGVGPTRRRRYGSAYTVVVKATKVAYGRRASVSQPAEPCRREAAPRSSCRVAAAWALLLSRHVLEGICEPRCRIGCSFGGWKSCQLTAGRIQARPIGRIADIQNPNGRRAQVAVTMNIGPLVLTNIGPPSGV